MVIKLKFKNLS